MDSTNGYYIQTSGLFPQKSQGPGIIAIVIAIIIIILIVLAVFFLTRRPETVLTKPT